MEADRSQCREDGSGEQDFSEGSHLLKVGKITRPDLSGLTAHFNSRFSQSVRTDSVKEE